MSQGWITARTADGSVVGLSKSVGQENSLLEFTAGQASPDPNTSPPYCIMVSTEKLVFFCDWSDYVASELV
jgi:hypothetical protein